MDTAAALNETKLQRERVLKLVNEARLQRLEDELKTTKKYQPQAKCLDKISNVHE